MIEMKYDLKTIRAFEQGLQHGVEFKVLGLPTSAFFNTKKESIAYDQALNLSATVEDFTTAWRIGDNLLHYAILFGHLKPVGWKMSKVPESNFRPFIEEAPRG